MFGHLAMLDFETVLRVSTHSIAIDRCQRRATAVDGRNARVTAAVKSATLMITVKTVKKMKMNYFTYGYRLPCFTCSLPFTYRSQ